MNEICIPCKNNDHLYCSLGDCECAREGHNRKISGMSVLELRRWLVGDALNRINQIFEGGS